MSKVFSRVSGVAPGRSVFDLSYEKKLTCDMGQLIPVMCDEMVPGDKFQIGCELVVRMQPLVAPILHEVSATVHYWFVPYRLLWDEWEDFITGGPDGDLAPAIPEWEPTDTTVGSLWDYLGFPTGVDPDGAYPIDFPRRAYAAIYNAFYRDQNLIAEVAATNEDILLRSWEKDYFTASLPSQQRGTAPGLPISGTVSAEWSGDVPVKTSVGSLQVQLAAGIISGVYPVYSNVAGGGSGDYLEVKNADIEANTIDLGTATTFDVADIRLATQLQRWLERQNRGGARYVETLRSHFGIAPKDERFQRPEYIGGMKVPVVISEVLQTSSTDATSPQANMAGHGLGVDRRFCASFTCPEYGLVMGILSVMPRPAYQQGIDRQWLRRTKFDFYWPEFANLSEQAVLRAEIYANGVDADNNTIFGYIGRYDEMRVKRNQVVGKMRTDFDEWHLSRQFAAAPELNQAFIECVPDKRIFAVENEPGLIVNCRNVVRAVRPLPVASNPGRLDH